MKTLGFWNVVLTTFGGALMLSGLLVLTQSNLPIVLHLGGAAIAFGIGMSISLTATHSLWKNHHSWLREFPMVGLLIAVFGMYYIFWAHAWPTYVYLHGNL